MTSPFDDAVAASSAAIDAVMGERLQIRPMMKPELGSSGPDPSRPDRVVVGVVTTHSVVAKLLGAGALSRDTAELAERKLRVSFDERLFPDPASRPRIGDHLVRLDKPAEPLLRFGTPMPVAGRVVHLLAPIGT